MILSVLLALILYCGLAAASAAPEVLSDAEPLRLPPIGGRQLRVLTPEVLELTIISTKRPDPARLEQWNFVNEKGACRLPSAGQFLVSAGGRALPVKGIGFKRRVVYAPLRPRDLRIGNFLYLQLGAPVRDGELVEVRNPDKKLWSPAPPLAIKAEPLRPSPAIHVNQTGYMAAHPKKAVVGYYLGTLGEMEVRNQDAKNVNEPPNRKPQGDGAPSFALLEAHSEKEVFRGTLTRRPDQGFPVSCYQKVFEADFSAFKTAGEYRLFVPGLGTSFAFFIDDAVAGAFARTYALGLYHQRCGTATALPFTRFTHGPCHTAPAEVPEMSQKFASANESLAKESASFKDNPRHTAPQLKDVASSLYPFLNKGPIDLRGGHHDAGDYSKYTINSASFIHILVFAADALPGVAALDNLGLPESGDGKSDILQEARWEADFLAKMQDADGGFYFLVYPREREYEDNVTPDHGDPQIVFPKTTSVTAAATAALAQCASSPAFKRQFPEAAALYLDRAKKGWAFLERALAKYGKDGAYQRITHYGDEFMHDDELAWAACELYLATGEPALHEKLLAWLNPADPATRRWGWQRLYDSYGNAIRSYAFAARTGRLKTDQLNRVLLDSCENEIAAAGQDQLLRAQHSAYGTSFPDETKRTLSAGWYFSMDAAWDLAVALQLEYPALRDPRPAMLDALLSNLNYEQGCNPVNVAYLTGLGWKRQHSIVHQWALNAPRALPPDGVPVGNIQGGMGWNGVYEKELDLLSFPSDGERSNPYPFYDRWADGWNVSQEFVILNQARALGCLAWLMAQTPLKDQAWKPSAAQIVSAPSATNVESNLSLNLNLPPTGKPKGQGSKAGQRFALRTELDLSGARVVWESDAGGTAFGQTWAPAASAPAPEWIETEAQLPDGRRVFAVKGVPGGN